MPVKKSYFYKKETPDLSPFFWAASYGSHQSYGRHLQEVRVKLVYEEWVDAIYRGSTGKDMPHRGGIVCEVMKYEPSQRGMGNGAGEDFALFTTISPMSIIVPDTW